MKPSNASNQREKLLTHLLSGQALTEDLGRSLFGVRRNAARISELRKQGYDIKTSLGEHHVATWTLDPRNPRKAIQAVLPFEEGSTDR